MFKLLLFKLSLFKLPRPEPATSGPENFARARILLVAIRAIAVVG
jgi:hypothetical protein